MDPKKMTGKVQEALQGALNLAQELSNCQFGATHLAVCLFEDNGGIARSASFKVVGEEGWRSIKVLQQCYGGGSRSFLLRRLRQTRCRQAKTF